MGTNSKGHVEIEVDQCKGCGVCVEVCPPGVLELAEELSPYGVHAAQYKGEGCTGCSICYYVCPEPGGITVYKYEPAKAEADSSEEKDHAGAV